MWHLHDSQWALSMTCACRQDMPLPIPAALLDSSAGLVLGPNRAAKMDVDTLAQWLHQTSSDEGPSEVQPDGPIIAAPRDFLKAAMRAREALQPLQVVATPSLSAL